MLRSADPAYDAEDLEKIIAVCSRVPAKPAESFQEAVQSLWFAHILNTWEDGINANSLGRLDQILYPYYKADLEKGKLTKESAFEMICCLWLKLHRDYDVQQSCVGGTAADGSSQVNELSYLMLDAVEQLNYKRNILVFQPHTYSRTKAFLDDFADALSLADMVVLADIYAARETDDLGVSSKDILDRLKARGADAYYFPTGETFEGIEKFLLKNCIDGDLLITMGAGNILEVGEHILGL